MTKLTVTTDLRSRFGSARDQQLRPTCIAFATSDAHAAANGRWAPLSVEHLYYQAVRRSGKDPKTGVGLAETREALHLDGQPDEFGWPYLDTLPTDLATWRPPAGLNQFYRRTSNLATATFESAVKATNAGTPSILVMSISDAFYIPTSDHVVDSTEPVDKTRNHAVVISGTGSREAVGYLLVRNSWGDDWGDQGYGWLSERYVRPRIIHIVEIGKVP